MITAGDFRKGVTFEMEGNVWIVVEFLHVKPGKGSPFVRTKLKNVVTGQVLERTFNPTDKFQVAVIERKEMQYLYNEGDLYYFMDMETYDQIPLNKSQVEDAMCFMKENMNAQIQFYKGSAFSVLPPTFVEHLQFDRHCGRHSKGHKINKTWFSLPRGFIIKWRNR